MALLMGLGGGITRDVLVNQVPGALTNPAYITVCVIAGFIGYHLAFTSGQLFREGLFQFVTEDLLPLYAIVGAQKGVIADLPVLGVLALAVVLGPTAGRWYVDVSCGVPPKQFHPRRVVRDLRAADGAHLGALRRCGAQHLGERRHRLRRRLHRPDAGAVLRLEQPAGRTQGRVPPRRRTPSARRKLQGKSQRELKMLGLTKEDEDNPQ